MISTVRAALSQALKAVWPIVDRRFYLYMYPDVARAGVDPREHYSRWGRAEGRKPNAGLARLFDLGRLCLDRKYYLAKYPDLVAAGVDPTWHYLLAGRDEGRSPNAAVDALRHRAAAIVVWIQALKGRPTKKWTDLHRETIMDRARRGKRFGLWLALQAARRASRSIGEPLLAGIMPITVVGHDKRTWLSVTNVKPAAKYVFQDHEVIGRTRAPAHHKIEVPSQWVVTIHSASVIGAFQVVSHDEFVHFEPAADPNNDFVAGQGHYVVGISGTGKALVYCNYQKRSWLAEGVLLSGRCSPNYYHWLVEYLGRAHIIRSVEGLTDLPLIVDAKMYPQELDSLRIIFPNQEIHFFEPGDRLDVDVLHIPSIPTFLSDSLKVPLWKGAALSHDSLTYLRKTILNEFGLSTERISHGSRRIYLTRRTGRMVLNNNAVEQLLESLGFEIVDTGKMTFREQVELFAEASMIVGPLGAAFANLIFASSGCKVLGLVSPFAVMFPLQASLARFSECRFKLLGGIQKGYRAGDEDHPETLKLDDFMNAYEMDLAALETAIRDF